MSDGNPLPTVTIDGRPDASRPHEDELLIRLDSSELGGLAVGTIANGPHDWPTRSDDRKAWFIDLLDTLEDLADSRKLQSEREGVYSLAIDHATNEVTRVWAFEPWMRETTTTTDIQSAL